MKFKITNEDNWTLYTWNLVTLEENCKHMSWKNICQTWKAYEIKKKKIEWSWGINPSENLQNMQ